MASKKTFHTTNQKYLEKVKNWSGVEPVQFRKPREAIYAKLLPVSLDLVYTCLPNVSLRVLHCISMFVLNSSLVCNGMPTFLEWINKKKKPIITHVSYKAVYK